MLQQKKLNKKGLCVQNVVCASCEVATKDDQLPVCRPVERRDDVETVQCILNGALAKRKKILTKKHGMSPKSVKSLLVSTQ